MKKLGIAFILTVVLGTITVAIGSWWWLLILTLVVGLALHTRHPSLVFFTMFFAGATIYSLGGLWYSMGEGELPQKVAELFSLSSSALLLLVTAIIGGLSTGIFACFGTLLRSVIFGFPPKKST